MLLVVVPCFGVLRVAEGSGFSDMKYLPLHICRFLLLFFVPIVPTTSCQPLTRTLLACRGPITYLYHEAGQSAEGCSRKSRAWAWDSMRSRAVLNEEKKKKKCSCTQVSQKCPRAHHVLAVGCWWLAIGNWRLMAVGGG